MKALKLHLEVEIVLSLMDDLNIRMSESRVPVAGRSWP
jgi:hypothetical protein